MKVVKRRITDREPYDKNPPSESLTAAGQLMMSPA